MGQGRVLETLEDFRRGLKNGFGIGTLAEYKPWFGIRDVPSKGSSLSPRGLITGRSHELISFGEQCFFMIAEFCPEVIDIREQFPLLPMSHALKIAALLGIAPPTISKTQVPTVQTTDFLLTLQGATGHRYMAVSVKPEESWGDPRVAEKLELERIWWELLGVPFRIFSASSAHKNAYVNISWITSEIRRGQKPNRGLLKAVLDVIEPGQFVWTECVNEVSNKVSARKDDAILALKYLIYSHHLSIEIEAPILESNLINIMSIKRDLKLEGRYAIDRE